MTQSNNIIVRTLPLSINKDMIKESDTISKHLETKLPDQAIIRLLEVSMEEMVLFEVNNPMKEISQNYRDYLKSFLYTQYGLPKLASTYCG